MKEFFGWMVATAVTAVKDPARLIRTKARRKVMPSIKIAQGPPKAATKMPPSA
ncbi:hypothetical protein D3C81_1816550 [compost metagenome]